MIAKLLEQMMGEACAEFEQVNVLMSIETLAEARDLANQLGVPLGRLLAELLPPALIEARSEWRSLQIGTPLGMDHAEAATPSFRLPTRVK